jgi:hypothetical protein
MKLNTQQLQFLARLSKSPDGAMLVQLLRDMVHDHDKAARTARGEDVHRSLGAADGLDKLIADIMGAGQSLARVEQAPRGRFNPTSAT